MKINFPIYTYCYLVYYNTDEGRRFCRNMSVKKLKVVVYVLKILTSLLLNRPFGNIRYALSYSYNNIYKNVLEVE